MFIRPVSLVVFLFACVASLHAVPSVEDFFKRPDITGVGVSRDGRYVSFLTPSTKDYYDLNAYDMETGAPLKFDLKSDDVMYYYWLDNGRMVLTTQRRPFYWWRQSIFDIKQRKLTDNLTYLDLFYLPLNEIRDRPGFFYAYFPDFQHNQPEIAVIDSKKVPAKIGGLNHSRFNVVSTLSIPTGEFRGTIRDHRGEIRVVELYSKGQLHDYYRRSATDGWSELPFDPEYVSIRAFDQDPDLLYVVLHPENENTSSLHRYRISKNEYGPALFQDSEYSIANCGLLMTENNDELLGIDYSTDRPVQIALSPLLKEVKAQLDAQLPGRSNLVLDYDEKLSRFIIASQTDRNIAYLIYDHPQKSLSALPEPYPWLQPEKLQPMQVIHYQARDGLKLEGYLTCPSAKDGIPPPLIVIPHGGPWVRDEWGFDLEAQFFASRGYAVFQPNYRGSSGYGESVSIDGRFEFRKMHDDVTDGVRYLISHHLVDPSRIAIYGASFGGYLSMCGAALEPDLYRCAVTFAGVFNWQQMIQEKSYGTTHNRFVYDFYLKNLGDPVKNKARFDEMSPINYVAAIKCPVFVIHGKEDEVVDVAQSKRLLTELERHHIRTESLFFSDEGHGFFERENKIKFYAAIEKFLAKYMSANGSSGKN